MWPPSPFGTHRPVPAACPAMDLRMRLAGVSSYWADAAGAPPAAAAAGADPAATKEGRASGRFTMDLADATRRGRGTTSARTAHAINFPKTGLFSVGDGGSRTIDRAR